MIVCTPEAAREYSCCMMPKKCLGDDCMAWNELGDRGFCGMGNYEGEFKEIIKPALTVTESTAQLKHGDEIRDENGNLLFTVTFVPPELPHQSEALPRSIIDETGGQQPANQSHEIPRKHKQGRNK